MNTLMTGPVCVQPGPVGSGPALFKPLSYPLPQITHQSTIHLSYHPFIALHLCPPLSSRLTGLCVCVCDEEKLIFRTRRTA